MSIRAEILIRRTYSRPKDDGNFETWDEVVDRSFRHQKYLWERAKGSKLNQEESGELVELGMLMRDFKCSLAGRTLWLGGTEMSRRREASQFNCSFSIAETVSDCVNIFWLLLQGCGTGFKTKVGCLNGFSTIIPQIEIKPSIRAAKDGEDKTTESYKDRHWTLTVGDSAEGWAIFIGKLLSGKYPGCKKLTLDYSQIRPPGSRLKGYGWICNGYKPLAIACNTIVNILNRRAGQLLGHQDIHDIINLFGTILSTRRASEISLFDFGQPGWRDFAICKQDYYSTSPWRGQSNNSLLFYQKPTISELRNIFELMQLSGGSEPGFINAQAAKERAPWWSGVNPCAEILLANKGFCNLVETDVAKFRNDMNGLLRALYIIARANYRQTLVELRDGILTKEWHQNNEFLRLCGVSITGIIRRPDLRAYDLRRMRDAATQGANSMADGLGLQRPKNITCGKPSGTLSKIMDTTEGIHKPIGKYILNNIAFSINDPVVEILKQANYKVIANPADPTSVLISFPVAWTDIDFSIPETAISQLTRYRFWMRNWCDQNMSCTIYYTKDEIEDIIKWLDLFWDDYVGVSFLLRHDDASTVNAPYLPQQIVTKETYEDYVSELLDVNISNTLPIEMIEEQGCESGACPVK